MKSSVKMFFILLLIGIPAYFLFFQSDSTNQASSTNNTELQEVDELVQELNKKGGFFDQVGKEMKNSGYAFQTAGSIYSKDNIQVAVIVPDDIEITEKMLEDILGIYQQMIVKENLDPNAFNIQVTHSADLRW